MSWLLKGYSFDSPDCDCHYDTTYRKGHHDIEDPLFFWYIISIVDLHYIDCKTYLQLFLNFVL